MALPVFVTEKKTCLAFDLVFLNLSTPTALSNPNAAKYASQERKYTVRAPVDVSTGNILKVQRCAAFLHQMAIDLRLAPLTPSVSKPKKHFSYFQEKTRGLG